MPALQFGFSEDLAAEARRIFEHPHRELVEAESLNDSSPSARNSGFQWSLASLLAAIALASVFFGLLTGGQYALAFLYLTACSMAAMVGGVAAGRERRFWSAFLMAVAFGYAGVNVAVFWTTMALDAFAIFELSYMIPAVILGPATLIVVVFVVAGMSGQFHWLTVVGFSVWTVCVGFAHGWVIAQCSAGV